MRAGNHTLQDLIGRTLGHYRVVEKIGEGGMGVVYRAHDPRIGRDVAVKVLPATLSHDDKRLARFEQEARSAGTLNHPNILAIHDVGRDQGSPFLVTELLEGETLRNRLNSGTLTRRKVMEYGACIADGLAAAHAKNIVHRDLKPENVFITRDGRLKILDFGLAKLAEPDPDQPISTESPTEALTGANIVVGTPGYISPEQLRGQSAGPRSDIFAFGVILYEMISGRRPFVGDSAVEISASIMRDEPMPLSGDDDPVSPTLERVIRQCLEKNPSERFESAHDLAHMLRAVSETGEVTMVARTAPRTRNWLRPALAAAVVVVVAVIASQLLDLRKAPALPDVKHIAVLPFETDSDDPDDLALAAGLAEIVADGLMIMERETRGAVWAVQLDPQTTLEQARTKHNVTIGILGMFRPRTNRVRLDLELVDPASGRVFVRQRLDEDLRNLAGLQNEPVRMIWDMLGFGVTPAAVNEREASLTNTSIASRAYIIGRGRLNGADNEAELLAAVESLELALKEDPGYAPARLALARTFGRLFEETRDDQWKKRAVAEAEYVIRMDSTAFEPYVVLGTVYGIAGQTELELESYRNATSRANVASPFDMLGNAAIDAGEFDEAERMLQKAINLRPGWATTHLNLAYLYLKMNRYDAATNEYRQAIQAAPENQSAHSNLGVVLYFQNRREEAEKVFKDALQLGPKESLYSNLGTLYFEDGRFGDSAEMFERAIELFGENLPPGKYFYFGNLASAEYWAGERESATSNYQTAIELGEALLDEEGDDVGVMVDLAGYHAVTGQPERSMELLEIVADEEIADAQIMGAIAECYADLNRPEEAFTWIKKALESGLDRSWIDRRPSFNKVRSNERFRALLAEHDTN